MMGIVIPLSDVAQSTQPGVPKTVFPKLVQLLPGPVQDPYVTPTDLITTGLGKFAGSDVGQMIRST
jgi:hypothetical protein